MDGCGCGVTDVSFSEATQRAVIILESVPGLTPAHPRDFNSARQIAHLQDGTTLRTWKNLVGVDHVFLADDNDRMIYRGFVGWIHSESLHQAIARIKRELI